MTKKSAARITRAAASNVASFPGSATRERRGSVFVVPGPAEWMPGRIQQNADVIVRSELGDPRAQGHGVGDGRAEIGHLDVEVHHRALLARCCRPDQRHVVLGAMEDHVRES